MPDLLNATSGTIYAFGQNDICGGGTGSNGGGSVAGLVSTNGGTSYDYIVGPDPAPGVFVSPSRGGVYKRVLCPPPIQISSLTLQNLFIAATRPTCFSTQLTPPRGTSPPAALIASGNRRTSPTQPCGAAGTESGGTWSPASTRGPRTWPDSQSACAPSLLCGLASLSKLTRVPIGASRFSRCVAPANMGNYIVWSRPLGCWLSVGFDVDGWSYSTSTNLTTWSSMEFLINSYNASNPISQTYQARSACSCVCVCAFSRSIYSLVITVSVDHRFRAGRRRHEVRPSPLYYRRKMLVY